MTARGRPWEWVLVASAALAAAGLTTGCGAHAEMANLMHESWQIIREYDRDGYTYYVVQEGPRYAKIVQLPSGPVYTIYEVDTLTHHCKWGEVLVDCRSVQADPDLGGWVTWGPQRPPLPAPPPARLPAVPSSSPPAPVPPAATTPAGAAAPAPPLAAPDAPRSGPYD